ncbi:MAG TPA: cytochrome P450 [Acidimicrobiia bacterium]|nr:cytochrome P450 [Acidimicrobiia bacterium]
MTAHEPVREPVVDFDHYRHRSIGESDRAWRALRERCPVAWTEANGGHWVVAGYDEVAAAFRDWETFSSRRTDPEVCSLSVGNLRVPPLYPEELDPPEWYPLRRVLSEVLSPNAVARLAPRIEHWVTFFVDQFIERGSCELAAELTCRVPAAVVLELLGFPPADWERIQRAFHGIAAYDRTKPEFVAAAADIGWVSRRVAEEMAERRRAPRDDAMSFIAAYEYEGVRIAPEDAEAVVLLTIGGGVDTTTSVSSAALLHLARHPDDRRRLLDDPAAIDGAIEEFLRVYPPARTHARTAVRDTELGGCRVTSGDRVLLSEVSANHDEHAFPDADRFVIDRFPNRHVAFGMGIHRCPGSHLARAQFKVMLQQVLERMPDYTVRDDDVVEYPNWSSIGGWARLRAEFTSGPRRLPPSAPQRGAPDPV